MLLFWNNFLVTLIKMLQIPLGVVPHQNFSGAGEEINGISGWTLSNLLIIKTALFIGYSLDDPDFRQIWQVIFNRLGRLRRLAYTIMVSASTATISRYERRGVKVINIPGKPNDYPEILEGIFNELRSYWSDKIIETSFSTEDDSSAELVMPKESKSRLCFFSVPTKMSAFYKSFVFPIAEKYGFVPTIAIDVISPGENIAAKISALIEKSELIIVDATSQSTVYELQMAASKKRDRIIVIFEEGARLLVDPQGFKCLSRPAFPDESDRFVSELDERFQVIAEEIRPEFAQEPLRLLRNKEYRASVISSISLLENELKRAMSSTDITWSVEPIYSSKYYSFKRLINFALERDLITENKISEIQEWSGIRNRVVHTGEAVSAKKANAIVNGVMEIVERIRRKYNNHF